MPAVCKVGDIGSGTCSAHESTKSYNTILQTGANTVFVNGQPIAVVGSTIGAASCGHPTIALTGSSTVFAEGSAVVRVSDTGSNNGPYISQTGSNNVNSG